MVIQIDIAALLALLGVPSAITGFCFWLVQRGINRRDQERESELQQQEQARQNQEEARKRNEFLVIKGVGAAIALGEATAQSIQRLDKECNGQMSAALKYAQKVKHEQKDFLQAQGIDNIY